MISLGGGEAFYYFKLMLDVSDFLRRQQERAPARQIYLRDVPTNGTLWRPRDLAEIAKRDNLNLAFSLDGLYYSANSYRFHARQLWQRVLSNAILYTQLKHKPPVINMTVHPATARNVFPQALSLLNKGFSRIRVMPACGQRWQAVELRCFYTGLRELLLEYIKHGRKAGWRIEPFEASFHRPVGEMSGMNICGMGKEVVFDPEGNAFPCELVVQMPRNMQHQYYLGNIAGKIDLEKNARFNDLKVCHYPDVQCCCGGPNAICKRLCLIYDAFAWQILPPESINNVMDFERKISALFQKISTQHPFCQRCD
jgi:radical SAM protein with 4Fe4S-binding SPASM domain